jgi:CDP-diacylglycerol--serine O-phosphatidyltransferase
MIKKQIPNLFTLLNLFSGVIAVIMAATDKLIEAAFFVFLGIFFDFFDGFFARKFNITGEFGKQLDSLADMVTSGVVPGIIMFQLILFSAKESYFMELSCEIGNWYSFDESKFYLAPLIGLIIPLASAYRLAKFNLDERQTSSFIGLPTPALAIFVVSLPLIIEYSDYDILRAFLQNTYVLISIPIIGSYLLNAEIPLFSLKFKNYKFTDNKVRYTFLILSILLFVIFNIVAIPLVIILYIFISMLDNIRTKKKHIK